MTTELKQTGTSKEVSQHQQADPFYQANLLQHVSDAIIATDLNFAITNWNRAAETLYGWSTDEVIGQMVDDLLQTKYAYDSLEQVRQHFIEQGVWHGEAIQKRKDGAAVHVLTAVSLIEDDAGHSLGIVTVNRDITEHNHAKAALQVSEARLNGIIESAMDAIISVDEEQRIVLFNAAAEKMFGYDAANVIGQPLDRFISNRYQKAHHKHIKTFGRTGVTNRTMGTLGTIFGRRVDGEEFPIEASISQVDIAESRLYTVILRDVTERKRAEEARASLEKQLRQAQKMEAIGHLTAGIAHDFNNLISVITLNTELMQMRLKRDDPLYQKTTLILDSGLRAARLIRQLLIFSRKQPTTPKIMSLNDTITEISRLLERIIGEHIEINLNLASDLLLTKIDPVQIEQIVINLAVNARDAMPNGGKLILKTTSIQLDKMYTASHIEVQPGEYVLLTVSDTGAGMSQKVQSRLFEPFFTTKAEGKGTGLGLATVYGIVKQNQGHIRVHSEVGRGSTFKVYLPRTSETAAFQSLTQKRKTRRGHETILVVEDDKNIRSLIQDALQEQGYMVLTAENGVQALQVPARHTGPIHLLLTDVIMPGMSGRAVAEALTQRYPQLKVIFMSGYTDEVVSHHGTLEDGIILLQKPFSFMEMVHQVQEVLMR